MATISLAMVCKDEGETLRQAVASVRHLCDQVVIGVDDSCTDDTPAIARELADVYFEFTWNDDFSAARNEAIARCTEDLILILDGHEFMPNDTHPTAAMLARMRGIDTEVTQVITPLSLIETLRANGLPAPFDVVCITLAMNTDEVGLPQLFFLQPRIFKNHIGIHYESAVHNFLTGYNKEGALGCPEGLLIHNMPAKREEKRKGQRKRMNISGLWKDIKANPKEARPYFYLGNTYADMGNSEMSLRWYERYLKHSTFGEEKYQVFQQLAVLWHRHRKDSAKAREYALKALATQYRRNEPLILLGEIAFEDKDYEQAIHWYNLAAEIPAPSTVMFLQGPAYAYMPDTKRMLCYEAIGQLDRAMEFCQKALSWRPGDPTLITHLEGLKEKQRGDSGKNRNLLMVDKIGSFTGDLAQAFAARWNVDRVPACDPRWKGWADAVWFEWCDENLIEASRQPWTVPVICRLHSYEAFGEMPAYVNWANVDLLIFVADHIKEMFLARWPEVAKQVHIVVIHNGLDMDKLTFRERTHGKTVGCLGFVNNKKGLEGMVDCAYLNPDLAFRVAGQFQDAHLAKWFEDTVGFLPNVWYDGVIAPERKDEWLDGIDYLISPSICESFGFTIAEAAAKGIKPLLRQRPGVSDLWPADWVWLHPGEFRKILDGPYDSKGYRAWVEEHYTLTGMVDRILPLVDELWAAKRGLLPAAGKSWLGKKLEMPVEWRI